MAKLGRMRVVRVDLEAVAGTATDPPTTELLTYDAKIQPNDDMIQREPDGAYGGQAKAERGPSLGTCTFRVELRSDGTSALDDGIKVCFQACGTSLAAGPPEVLSPVTAVASQKTITIDVWRDGHHERLYGAMGTWELTGEWGKQVFIEFTFTGIYSELADAAMPATSHTAQPPLLAKGATLTLGAYTPKISRFSINPNSPVEVREDIAAANGEGIGHYIIGPGRRYMIGMDPEAVAAATWDIRALWLAKTEAAFSLLLSDGDVDVTIAAPKLQHSAPQEGMRDSKLIHEMNAQCNADSGDDELTITAAAAA